LRARADDPPIEMVIVTCGNPLVQVPNTNLMKEAFAAVNTLVNIEKVAQETNEAL